MIRFTIINVKYRQWENVSVVTPVIMWTRWSGTHDRYFLSHSGTSSAPHAQTDPFTPNIITLVTQHHNLFLTLQQCYSQNISSFFLFLRCYDLTPQISFSLCFLQHWCKITTIWPKHAEFLPHTDPADGLTTFTWKIIISQNNFLKSFSSDVTNYSLDIIERNK